MKKEVILVPKDKCPLDVLAEMGERTKNSWIFLDTSALQKLLLSDGCKPWYRKHDTLTATLKWEATDEYPETSVLMEVPTPRGWGKILSIKAEDIAFTISTDDPEDIFFLKMAE